MKYCPGCNWSTIDQYKFCWRCGKRLESMRKLTCGCGYELSPHDAYCSMCGVKISGKGGDSDGEVNNADDGKGDEGNV